MEADLFSVLAQQESAAVICFPGGPPDCEHGTPHISWLLVDYSLTRLVFWKIENFSTTHVFCRLE